MAARSAGEGLGPEGLATGKLGLGFGHCLQRGLPAGFQASPKIGEREVAAALLAHARRTDALRPGRTVIGDKGLAGRDFEDLVTTGLGVRLIRPDLPRLKLPDRTHDAITAAWRPSAAQPRPPAPRGCGARQARQAGHRTDHPRLLTGRQPDSPA